MCVCERERERERHRLKKDREGKEKRGLDQGRKKRENLGERRERGLERDEGRKEDRVKKMLFKQSEQSSFRFVTMYQDVFFSVFVYTMLLLHQS